ncbi:hypothetical protein COCC4DRAFT_33132 [Bipolaris maydis ATCC 48331]|uniref:Uncharacterized protein n=2 Tax=Cochliobolus heterostrophus TaxID=5016 RepID=M2TXX0_COCH5|nr:uncharacterized protein COCC4DRAFT_33132 [Bipolaris maydis ATCC 48331]EMD86566.1 hypothetical protein COCHEDRAFT_1023827 [Bipolaris maydis C5]ENI02981.1 hypothetical protein COCC4DRAFT_33132 [Bipolaris maydis ATCC 48331]
MTVKYTKTRSGLDFMHLTTANATWRTLDMPIVGYCSHRFDASAIICKRWGLWTTHHKTHERYTISSTGGCVIWWSVPLVSSNGGGGYFIVRMSFQSEDPIKADEMLVRRNQIAEGLWISDVQEQQERRRRQRRQKRQRE